MPTDMPMLSVLVPVYFNEQNLPSTLPALQRVLDGLPSGMDGELICVDDGSGDESWRLLAAASARDPRIKAIRLSRNFGAYMALLAALDAAKGDCIAIIMADLQDPPELLLQMVHAWQQGNRIVIASREQREDPILQRAFAGFFWKFMRRFGIPNLPPGGFDCVLFDKIVGDVLRTSREKNSHFMLQIFTTGFPFHEIRYVRRKREAGRSRWTFARRYKLFVDSAIAFSYVPLRAIGLIGGVTALAGFGFAVKYVWMKLVQNAAPEGWTALMVAVLVLGGIQMIMLWLIGEYIWRTYDETRRRPPYIVAERVNL